MTPGARSQPCPAREPSCWWLGPAGRLAVALVSIPCRRSGADSDPAGCGLEVAAVDGYSGSGLYCNATCWERHARELAFGEAVFVDSPHGFRVELKPDGERVTVRVLGEVDLATAGDVEGPLRELLNSGFETVVLDLREVSFLDSSGIGVLISSHRYAQECGARLSIVVGRSRSREVMELSGVIDHLDVA